MIEKFLISLSIRKYNIMFLCLEAGTCLSEFNECNELTKPCCKGYVCATVKGWLMAYTCRKPHSGNLY